MRDKTTAPSVCLCASRAGCYGLKKSVYYLTKVFSYCTEYKYAVVLWDTGNCGGDMAEKYGPWSVERSIGEGGQAHVYLVSKDTETDNSCFALKRLRNTKRLDRFEAEIRVLQSISHPNIAEVIDHDIKGKKPYYVLPYFSRGNSIAANIHKIDLLKKFSFYSKILDAMNVAHEKGVVHRDLKPENILVKNDGEPVVADFGICFVDDGERLTVTEEVVGPRHFSAPEVEEGRQDEVSPHSDVYSLGKILYWLLTGKIVPRERHRQHKFELRAYLDNDRFEHFSKLLDLMIVENPGDRLPGAGTVMSRFDQACLLYREGRNVPSPTVPQHCNYCGTGIYETISKPVTVGQTSPYENNNMIGLSMVGDTRMRVMVCSDCGNVQLFRVNKLSDAMNPWKPN